MGKKRHREKRRGREKARRRGTGKERHGEKARGGKALLCAFPGAFKEAHFRLPDTRS